MQTQINQEFISNLFSIKDKVAIVTGGTGALGKAIALAYGLSGAKVVITGRNPDKLKETVAELRQYEIDIASFVVDPLNKKDVHTMVNDVKNLHGEINILAVCHGFNAPKGFLEQSVEEWQKIMDADLKSVYILCQQVAKSMAEQGKGGKIVVTSSARSKMGMTGYTGYCASKGACDLMIQSMACDLTEKYGINVNTINPTVFRSDLTEWMFDTESEVYKNFLKRLSIGRLGEPRDFVGLAIFLSSPASDFLTGGNYDATGGYWGLNAVNLTTIHQNQQINKRIFM